MDRWPLQPLLDLTGHNVTSLAATLGLAKSWIQTCEKRGLSDKVADRWAVKLGHHPGEVWPSWFDAYCDETSVLFVNLWAELREAAA